MSDWSENLDRIISNINWEHRILYFKSENRKVIEAAVNGSLALRAKLENLLCEKEKEEKTPKQKQAFDTMTYADMTKKYLGYRLNLSPSKELIDSVKLLKRKNPDGGDPIPIIPLFVTVTDFQIYTDSERSKIVKAFLDSEELKNALLLISSPDLYIPSGFSSEIELIADTYISLNDICEKITMLVREEEHNRGTRCFSDPELKRIAEDFIGLTDMQVHNVLVAMQDDLCAMLKEEKHRDLVREERVKEASKDPAIRFIELDTEEHVVGLGHYTEWLSEQKKNYANPEAAKRRGTNAPKGVLLCGVPGTGKTAMARETARVLGVPLIQFDVSRLQSSNYGASEAQLRRYLERISAFGSCVMLMDEIEKTFSVSDHTHEVKLAMLSQLLDWMQTRKANIFTFITANTIDKLPPELYRDGRISGRFMAFMPSCEDLADILQSKLMRYLDSGNFNDAFKRIITDTDKKGEPVDGESQKRNKTYRCDIFDTIAQEAKEDAKKGEYRYPFMTGANLESLLIMTLNRLLADAEKKTTHVSVPFGYEVFSKYMCECARSQAFVPQGQSNMEDVVTMWMKGQERQYQDVSSHTLLPFSQYKAGTFTKEHTQTDHCYDDYLIEIFRAEIEKKAENLRKNEEMRNKLLES